MNRKSIAVSLTALLALFLVTGRATGQGPDVAPENGVGTRGELSITATVNSLISYQGRLSEGGSPVTGDRDMTFRLYTDQACSTQVGSNIVRNNVSVNEGLFSTKLDVSQSLFNGQGLWLGVDVGNTGSNVVCEEIVPAPYALSLRPGAVISDDRSTVALNRYQTGALTYEYGVYARAEGAIFNYGVRGESSNGIGVSGSSDNGFGVNGYSSSSAGVRGLSDSGYGVYGLAIGNSGANYGVYGRTDSAAGTGVYAMGVDSGADLILGGNANTALGDDGKIYSDPAYSSSDIYIVTNDTVRIDLDNDQNGEDADFEIRDKDDTLIFNVDESGRTNIRGNLVIQSSSTGATIIELGEGLDYAEGFDVSDRAGIVPGAVLIIDPDRPGQLRLSDSPYDTRVAGIVAGARGLGSAVRLGAGQFDYDVALAGRVYCYVDATGAGVEPGDLLTTSATPGYAMKATDYARAQGAILGKAMERLEKGTKGQILVLVTLQ